MRYTGKAAVVAAAITLAWAVSGCGEKVGGSNAVAPAGSTATGAVTTTAGSSSAQLAPIEQASRSETFGSPSGNIACLISHSAHTTPANVRCELSQISFTPPPFPARCYHDGAPVPGSGRYGQVVYFSEEQEAGFACGASDTIGGARNMKVLEYGSSVTLAGFTCASTQAGIRCTRGDHYFRISSETYEFG
ncbi:hypothetical protein ACWIGW_19420 [Nocardia brasiliensis]